MNISVAITCVVIVLARICDVSLDTLRTASIVQGRRLFAAVLGFFQALIYITAIAKVLLNMDHQIYALAYALGYALGTYLGITIEQRLAFGLQVASLFTRRGAALTEALQTGGYRIAKVEGQARDQDVTILYVEVPRKHIKKLLQEVSLIDETCFCIVNDLRTANFASQQIDPNSIWSK